MLCVRPGVFDVRARPFLCNSEFRSDDFPTFDLPRKAISGLLSTGQCRRSKALFTNSADVIFIFNDYTGLAMRREKAFAWKAKAHRV
jgi:hypothetical protein